MIVLQSPVRFRALPMIHYEQESSQNCSPLARPRAIKFFLLSFYGLSRARDFAYQALSRFSACNIEKLGMGLGTRLGGLYNMIIIELHGYID